MRTVLIAVVATAALCATAWAMTFNSFIGAKEYRALSRAERITYIMGLNDMMNRMCREVYVLSDTSEAAVFCRRKEACTKDMTGRELTDFIEKFMSEVVVEDNNAMSSVFRAAINTRCPGPVQS